MTQLASLSLFWMNVCVAVMLYSDCSHKSAAWKCFRFPRTFFCWSAQHFIFIHSHLQEIFKGINPPAAVFLPTFCVKYELYKDRHRMSLSLYGYYRKDGLNLSYFEWPRSTETSWNMIFRQCLILDADKSELRCLSLTFYMIQVGRLRYTYYFSKLLQW